MIILGISAFYHDSAASLVEDGVILSASQEERFTRIKNDNTFPVNSINFCLRNSNISAHNIDFVVFYDKPILKFDRIFESYLSIAPLGFGNFLNSFPEWIKNKLFQKNSIIRSLKHLDSKINWEKKLVFSEHHLSHLASAFYPSPFEEAAIISLDGVGEWSTSTVAIGSGREIDILSEINFPHSLGLLYSAFTYYCGFKVNSGEYKLMGLAPYGSPIYAKLIKDHLIDLKSDGSFRLNMSYFDYVGGMKMINSKFEDLFSRKARKPDEKITQMDMDLASSIQCITEEVLEKIANNVAKTTGQSNLCLAGGVALNCVANGKLLRKSIFNRIWVQPAAGDAGGAIGAALAFYYMGLRAERTVNSTNDGMSGAFLGPEFSDSDIEDALDFFNAKYEKLSEEKMLQTAAESIALGKCIGWFQGRAEFGPRALGSRSILADPRSKHMQSKLNLKIKFRESFRPFAPSILREYLEDWFDTNVESPYMMLVSRVKNSKIINTNDSGLFGIDKLNTCRSEIPAVTHVDYTARVQTVDEIYNKIYYKLIKKFYEITECPILINTSFNVRGEPIVCTPKDAYNCFMNTGLDSLIIGNYVLMKEDQNLIINVSIPVVNAED